MIGPQDELNKILGNNPTTTKVIPEELPTLSMDNLEDLNNLYPERCPDPKEDEKTMWMYAGKRELVRALTYQRNKKHKE